MATDGFGGPDDRRRIDAITTNTCPGCGGYLEDTWDESEAACCVCGFEYIYVDRDETDDSPDTPAEVRTDARKRRVQAGLIALITMFATGGMTEPSKYISPAEAGAVGFSLQLSSGLLWIFLGQFISIGLLMYAVGGRR